MYFTRTRQIGWAFLLLCLLSIPSSAAIGVLNVDPWYRVFGSNPPVFYIRVSWSVSSDALNNVYVTVESTDNPGVETVWQGARSSDWINTGAWWTCNNSPTITFRLYEGGSGSYTGGNLLDSVVVPSPPSSDPFYCSV